MITSRSRGTHVDVWFDGLDSDIALSADSRRGKRSIRRAWRDLGNLDDVLDDVEDVLRELLNDYR